MPGIIARSLLASLLSFGSPIAAPLASETSVLETQRRAAALFNAGQHAEAAAEYERAVAANSLRWNDWYYLAQARYRSKDYRRAIEAFERAERLGGVIGAFSSMAAYDAACCRALLGEKEAALATLRRALDLGFPDLEHARRDGDLASLRDDTRFKKWLYLDDVSALSRDEKRRFDLRILAAEIERVHYAPFRKFPRSEFEAEVKAIHDAIPGLSDDEIEIRLMALVARIGDGHTRILPPDYGGPGVPVEFAFFEEGLFVTRAAPGSAELAGARVERYAGRDVKDVLAAVTRIVSRDNDVLPLRIAPLVMRRPRPIAALGLASDPAKVSVRFRLRDGTEKDVVLEAGGGEPGPDWVSARKADPPLAEKNPGAPYWFEFLEKDKTVFFRFNVVRNDEKEPLESFCRRLFDFIDMNDVRKLVIDLRDNDGGNMTLNRPLVHGLIRCDEVNRPGALFVIAGRNTDSAAMNAAADIERETAAIFVGEPTGSSPNHVGESNPFRLPASGMFGSIANTYFQRGQPFDSRTFIAPRILAPPAFAHWVEGRDAALEAILREPMPDPL